MIPDIQVNFYTDETISKDLLQEAFSENDDQVLNKNFVARARADFYYIKNIFFYHNERLPGSPIEEPPLYLTLQKEDNLFPDNESNIFSGPEGAVGFILGIKPFKSLNICQVLADTLKDLFPTAIIGTDNYSVYFNSQIINISFIPEKGVVHLRIQSLDLPGDSTVTWEDILHRTASDLISHLEYED